MASQIAIPRPVIRKVQRQARPQVREHPGRRSGVPHGSHIDNLSALHKTIILCWHCAPKFEHKRHHYHKDQKFPYVVGQCDACKKHANRAHLFIHESFLSDSGGRLRSGQCWTPA